LAALSVYGHKPGFVVNPVTVLGLEACVRETSERAVLKGLRRDRREAYEAVIDAHYGSVYRLMLLLTGDADLAEDLTQEAFTSAWNAVDQFRGQAAIRTWLHRIAYHCFVDARRRRDRERAAAVNLGQRAAGALTDPVSRLMVEEKLARVYAGLESLDDEERVLLVLHYVEGLSYRQMAKVLDRPGGTVKWLVGRALDRLRRQLAQEVVP
jgi:RNA polymerase sigma-70 factor (ECF subfamily)